MKFLHIIILNAFGCALISCATLAEWQANPTVQFVETQALRLAQSYFANGGKTDSAWGISEGLNSIGAISSFYATRNAANANEIAAAKLKQTVRDFAGDQTAVAGLANGIAGVVAKAAPQTPEQRARITLALAAGIQKAAGQRHD